MSGQETENIVTIHIEQELKNSFLDYSMSVIVSRALPDVRDGLKPVHRRILYAMNLLKNYHNRPYLKSARIVGDVIGRFHPHGDASVYEALVRLAQSWNLRYLLVDGQGNFGSIDGDPPAAMRYTEARMAAPTADMMADLKLETVDFQPNYDERLMEPVVLPSKFPNMLVNGTSGIAVGMATNIPPHNLTEMAEAIVKVVDNPHVTIDELMQVLPGPDFPTGGFICGRHGIEDSRMAVREARRLGHAVFGITIDRDGKSWFPRIFGAGGFAVVSNPNALTQVLPGIYRHLIGI